MIINLYAVFDLKARAYMQAFQSQNDHMAIRGFSEACFNPEVPFSKYPKDYSLYKVGEYDDQTGTFKNEEPAPVPVISAVNAIQQAQEEQKYVQSLHMADNTDNKTPEKVAVNGHDTESVQSDSQH
jgi:hypothetical protein